jgi:hypothetical protein
MRLWPRRSNGKTEADAAIKTLAAGGDRWAPLAKLAETTPSWVAPSGSAGFGWVAGAARDRSQRAASSSAAACGQQSCWLEVIDGSQPPMVQVGKPATKTDGRSARKRANPSKRAEFIAGQAYGV